MKLLAWGLVFISCSLTAQIELSFQKDLFPEGIAVHPETKKVYLNSLMHNKIVRSNLDGTNAEEFTGKDEYGYLSGFGMTIKGDTLYALGNSLPKPQNKSIFLLLNTKTGKLITSYALKETGFAYLNDLAVGSNGAIFITDSESDKIYTINKQKDKLEVFLTHDELKHCNGIAISEDYKFLYLASYTSGLRVVDITTKRLVNKPNQYKGIDGLKWYKNSLIALVNTRRDATQNGVYRFQLNPNQSEITNEKKIAAFQEETDIPTTFAILKDSLYFVDDSQMDNMNQETYQIRDTSKLEPYNLMGIPLNPNVYTKNYCTEIGRFDLTFDSNEVAGAYLLKHKNALGAVWGKLEGLKMTGRWTDADGSGDIILTFTEDFSFFTADYRSDDEPKKWHIDSWHGALRPNGDISFEFNAKTFTCE
ncbi:MAG: SMP-30/gluconolactonase/LRE family protein [Bacteroidota bacterium]